MRQVLLLSTAFQKFNDVYAGSVIPAYPFVSCLTPRGAHPKICHRIYEMQY